MFRWFRDLGIKQKILFANSIAISFIVAFALTMYFSINKLLETVKWVTHTEKVIADSNEMMEHLMDMETSMRGFLITGESEFLSKFSTSNLAYSREREELKILVSDNPRQVQNLVIIENLLGEWHNETATPEIALRQRVNDGTASINGISKFMENELRNNTMNEIRFQHELFNSIENRIIEKRLEASAISTRNTIVIVFTGAGIAILIILGLGGLVSYSISKPLSRFVKSAKTIADGDLSERLDIVSKDETGALANAFNKMSDSLERRVKKRTSELSNEIAERRKSQVALQKSSEFIENILDITHYSVVLLDTDFNFIRVNRAYAELRRLDIDYFPGKNHFDLYPSNEMESIFSRVIETGKPYTAYAKPFEFPDQPELGVTYWNWSLYLTHNGDGEIDGLIFTLLNVTARKCAEEELFGKNEILETIFDTTHYSVVLLDSDFNFVKVNRAYAETCRLDVDYFPGKNHFDLYPGDEAESIFRQVVDTGEPYTVYARPFEFPDQPERGITYWDWSLYPVHKADGEIDGLIFTLLDVTERKRAEEALTSSEELHETILSNISDAVLITDVAGNFTFICINVAVIFGYSTEEVLALGNISNLIGSNVYDPKELDDKKELTNIELTVTDKQENQCDVLLNVKRVAIRGGTILHVCRDITEIRKMREELMKTDRLRSLQTLAGGIAHDFNNIFSGILANIGLAKIWSEGDSKILTSLVRAETGINRGKGLSSQLQTLSENYVPSFEAIDTVIFLRETAEFALQGRKSKCKFSIEDGILNLHADSALTGNLIQNILINADQSMPDGGEIIISAKNHIAKPSGHLVLARGEYIKLSIKDCGEGISKDIRDNIFDPFFTTKENGKGLGLATAHSSVKKQGGLTEVESEVGKGSTFHIYLPAVKKSDKVGINKAEIVKGVGKVLVLDDDIGIRRVLQEALQTLGYSAVLVKDGWEVINEYVNAIDSGNRFDVVILDLTVPGGMGGKETLKQLLTIDPNVKAIVSSGYSDDPLLGDYKAHGFHASLPKPVSLERLSRSLSQIITDDSA